MKHEVLVRANKNRAGEVANVWVKLAAFNDDKTRVIGQWALTIIGTWRLMKSSEEYPADCYIRDVKIAGPWPQEAVSPTKTAQGAVEIHFTKADRSCLAQIARQAEAKKAAEQAELKRLHDMSLYIWKARGHTEAEWYQFQFDITEKTKCINAAKMLIGFFDGLEKKHEPIRPTCENCGHFRVCNISLHKIRGTSYCRDHSNE